MKSPLKVIQSPYFSGPGRGPAPFSLNNTIHIYREASVIGPPHLKNQKGYHIEILGKLLVCCRSFFGIRNGEDLRQVMAWVQNKILVQLSFHLDW